MVCGVGILGQGAWLFVGFYCWLATVDPSSSLLQEAAAVVKGIDVYFDNDFLMRLQTNKINSLGCMFNSRGAVGSVPGG